MTLDKVLVVDDSELLHRMYDLVLLRYRQRGCTVLHARNGAEALEILRAEPEIELMLLDVNMPVLGGLDTLRRLRAIGWLQKGRVLMVSTLGGEEDVRRAIELGASGYVTKPVSPDSLHSVIERLAGIPRRSGLLGGARA